jgi:hypothetical protein
MGMESLPRKRNLLLADRGEGKDCVISQRSATIAGAAITSAPRLQIAFAKGAEPNTSNDASWNVLHHQPSVFSKN